jgi:uncharacterized membrane protein YeaQ/YmgE (transglycosylase-associated protein family)
MTGLIVWAIIGLIAGLLAAWILPDRKPGWIIVPMAVAAFGSFSGGVAGHVLTDTDFSDVPKTGIALSVIGSLIMLLVYWRFVPSATRRH